MGERMVKWLGGGVTLLLAATFGAADPGGNQSTAPSQVAQGDRSRGFFGFRDWDSRFGGYDRSRRAAPEDDKKGGKDDRKGKDDRPSDDRRGPPGFFGRGGPPGGPPGSPRPNDDKKGKGDRPSDDRRGPPGFGRGGPPGGPPGGPRPADDKKGKGDRPEERRRPGGTSWRDEGKAPAKAKEAPRREAPRGDWRQQRPSSDWRKQPQTSGRGARSGSGRDRGPQHGFGPQRGLSQGFANRIRASLDRVGARGRAPQHGFANRGRAPQRGFANRGRAPQRGFGRQGGGRCSHQSFGRRGGRGPQHGFGGQRGWGGSHQSFGHRGGRGPQHGFGGRQHGSWGSSQRFQSRSPWGGGWSGDFHGRRDQHPGWGRPSSSGRRW
jgi:hypothetical protein